MDFLNSQHLTSQDGYAHPFAQGGEFTYAALVSDLHEANGPSGIVVVSGKLIPEGKGKQYDVVFHWDGPSGRFVARESDRRLTIRPNDFVVFQFSAAVLGQPPCFISVRGKESIDGDSRRLKTHEAFTHFFLQPGEYAYRLGGASYRISVADHRSLSDQEHSRQTARPLVIMVNGRGVSAPHGRIVAGQSTIWAVEQGENIQIESVRAEPNGHLH